MEWPSGIQRTALVSLGGGGILLEVPPSGSLQTSVISGPMGNLRVLARLFYGVKLFRKHFKSTFQCSFL